VCFLLFPYDFVGLDYHGILFWIVFCVVLLAFPYDFVSSGQYGILLWILFCVVLLVFPYDYLHRFGPLWDPVLDYALCCFAWISL